MRRYVIAALLAMLLITFDTPGAQAVVSPPGPIVTIPGSVLTAKPCVTTTWRATYWGLPKTRVGERCYATPDMWVSRYWPKVGIVVVSGKLRPVYLRTV